MPKSQSNNLRRMSDRELNAELDLVEAEFHPGKEWVSGSSMDSAVTLHRLLSREAARRKAIAQSGARRGILARLFRRRK